MKQAKLRGASRLVPSPSPSPRRCTDPFLALSSRFARALAGMRITDDTPKSLQYWDGREDLVSPFKKACNAIIMNNVRACSLLFADARSTFTN